MAVVGVAIPITVDISWRGVLPVLSSLHWPALIALVVVWILGLLVHSFVLTAAAPSLSRRRALTLNITGSAVANVVPLGGAAGVELNRRMMSTWGVDARTFTGFTFISNLWDIAAKLLLPVVAVIMLANAGETVIAPLRLVSLVGAIAFVCLAALATALLINPRCAAVLGHAVEKVLRPGLRAVGRPDLDVAGALLEIRRQCAHLVADGWLRLSLGIGGYLALQGLLLWLCLHMTQGGNTWAEVLAAFAVERMLTILPITPGGVGVADLGLVGLLLAFGGDPTGVAAAAVLYRGFVFLLEIPVGGGVLGLWLITQRRARRRTPSPDWGSGEIRRIAHVTDVFLPRLGGIETHVDDLVRHQRALALDADVLTPVRGVTDDPDWVRRLPVSQARRVVGDYDLVHVHLAMLCPYGISVARAAIAAGVPTLITVHSMWAGAEGVVRLAAAAGLRRWPVAWSAVSDAAAQVFRRSLGGVEVDILPNAVDVAAWRRPRAPRCPASAEAGPKATAGPLTVVSVMRLMPRKRPVQLLRLFEQVRALAPSHDLRLLVVGDGPMRRRMERYVARHGLSSCVRITGRVPRREVLSELLSASIYVAPTPKESFGIAALEARCAGLPIVAYRRSGATEFIRDRVDGILVANDAEMVGALADLVLNVELRERISTHNNLVAPAFDWDDVLGHTDALYRKAQARAGARVHSAIDPAVPDVPSLLDA
ncbi:MAG: glycosyltransferase [Nocardioides sp.]